MSKEKIPISEGKIRGQLKDLEQVYKVNYMPEDIIKEVHYEDKIELFIGLEQNGQPRERYRSLRFTNPVQLKGFIMGLIKALFIFSTKRKVITPQNFVYQLTKFLKDVENVMRGKNV